ncbi:MAG: hypothetical protein KF898_06115 [Parachlamydiales bacterium]|nr:hypothetical protein [Verrucomicrobiota bacterium]MBX3719205.1 hypothetical protein [Candidatus Acheromyda pituitae]
MEDKLNRFDYGDAVKISSDAPEKYHPLEIGFICGMIEMDSVEAQVAYECVDSNWLYTVELLSGKSLLIPEKFLKKDD